MSSKNHERTTRLAAVSGVGLTGSRLASAFSVDNAKRLRRFWRMVDKRFKPADEAVAIFKAVYLRDGADVAVEVAKLVIGAAAVLIAHERGPDEARRILDIISAAQGQVS
ncbi:MAG: hypothetical protein WBL48_07220 [Pseudolabrys sp.]|jgi:calcineurin-like phosphoesterase